MSDTATSARPYLLRALHEWMSDNGLTPLMAVDATVEGVDVPADFVEDDQIVVNVSWSASNNLQLGNELITFEARFSGTPYAIAIPVTAVKGLYARETAQGMMFQDEPSSTAPGAAQPTATQPDGDRPRSVGDDDGDKPRGPGRPGLRLVK